MRHIPEDELHAYLDQGLSRTQCVEIESHLAGCSACRASRDRIAALRDRTTALLARLAPPLRVPPSFDGLRRKAAEAVSERRRRVRNAAWAASLVLAVGAGWTASSMIGPRGEPDARVATPARTVAPPVGREPLAAAVASRPARPAVADTTPEPAPVRRTARERAPARATLAAARPAPARTPAKDDSARAGLLAVLDAVPADSLGAPRAAAVTGPQLAGSWRTLSWDGAEAEAARRLPHIGGLPVVNVQVQAGGQGARPITVVAQQLASGEVIQTIEGPASDVSQLLARRHMSDPDHVHQPGDSMGHALGGAMAMQLGDRMLAITGALPSDSLRAMIRRLNVEMRSK